MTMNQRPPFPPASTARRWRTLGCALLAAGMLGNSLPLHAQQAATAPTSASRGRATVTLNFVNADIEAVTRAISAMLDRPIIVDPRVRGNITLYSEQPLTVREAYLNYLSALRGLGFTVVENAGLLKVVPEADAKLQAGTVQVGAPALRGDQIVTQVFRLNYENPNNLVTVLRPLISPNNTINANPTNNTLVITDYADNLQRIARIIAALDTPSATDVEVVPLQHAVAADLAPLVQRLAEGGGAVNVAPVPGVIGSQSGVSVIADARSNALILRAGNPARMTQLRAIIEKLDRPMGSAGPAGNIYVVYLKNADAAKLATVLRAAFGGGSGGTGSTGTGSFGSNSSSLAATQPNPNANVTSLSNQSAGGTSSSAATAPLAASAQPSTGGFIQADPSTNSLIITAPEPLYKQVRAVIDQLDSRRAQVYVEALIVEIDADRAAELGLQWMLLGTTANGQQVSAGAGTAFGTDLTNIINLAATLASGQAATALSSGGAPQGFSAFGVDRFGPNGRYGLGVLARAFESTTGTNILSTPNLVTLDNEEAKIVVGQNVPFVTGTFTNTSTGVSNPFQTVERKDVGLVLRIRPQIGEGNTVRMTIFQESSAVLSTTAAGTTNAGPSTTKRSIESTVVVDDGNVIVLGGLIEDNYTDTRSKVPLLGDIPVLGQLFRSETRSRKKTNLMVFLRPVVLRNQEASNQLSMDRYDVIRNQQIELQPPQRTFLPVNSSPVMPPSRSSQPGKPLVNPAHPQVEPPLPSSAPSSAPAQ
jgi:general secretion pathway protein D